MVGQRNATEGGQDLKVQLGMEEECLGVTE